MQGACISLHEVSPSCVCGQRLFSCMLPHTQDLCKAAGIPTGAYDVFTQPGPAKAYIRRQGAPIVVKADGLAAGKGVVVARSTQEAEAAVDDMLVGRKFGEAGVSRCWRGS